jgi:hypothetical protein
MTQQKLRFANRTAKVNAYIQFLVDLAPSR